MNLARWIAPIALAASLLAFDLPASGDVVPLAGEGDSKGIAPRFPFGIDPAKTVAHAYLMGDKHYIMVYLVGESSVVEIVFVWPGKDKASQNFAIPRGKEEKIVLHRGPKIAQYVLPSGPAVPRPNTPEFSETPARSGRILCNNPPDQEGDFKAEFSVSLEALDFGDGKLYKVDLIKMKLSVPPP